MANLYIAFSIQGFDILDFHIYLLEQFARLNSPFYPLYICFESVGQVEDEIIKGGEVIVDCIVEAYEDPEQGVRKISKITIQHISDSINVFLNGVQECRQRWYQVEKMALFILNHLYDSGYLIGFVSPKGLFPLEKIILSKKELEDILLAETLPKPDMLKAELPDDMKSTLVKPELPKKPISESSKDQWFKYYDDCKAGRIKYTLEDLSDDIGYSYGYTRQMYASYCKAGVKSNN